MFDAEDNIWLLDIEDSSVPVCESRLRKSAHHGMRLAPPSAPGEVQGSRITMFRAYHGPKSHIMLRPHTASLLVRSERGFEALGDCERSYDDAEETAAGELSNRLQIMLPRPGWIDPVETGSKVVASVRCCSGSPKKKAEEAEEMKLNPKPKTILYQETSESAGARTTQSKRWYHHAGEKGCRSVRLSCVGFSLNVSCEKLKDAARLLGSFSSNPYRDSRPSVGGYYSWRRRPKSIMGNASFRVDAALKASQDAYKTTSCELTRPHTTTQMTAKPKKGLRAGCKSLDSVGLIISGYRAS